MELSGKRLGLYDDIEWLMIILSMILMKIKWSV